MAKPRCPNCSGRRWTDDGRCRECEGFPTLGYQVADLIQSVCVIPDGDFQGEPYVLTDEMLRFVLRFYRVDPHTGRFHYRRGAQLRRPQKWGKGPFCAALVIAECHPDGPVRPDGWDSNGDPVGRSWPTPHWQITAVSEGQTDNVWRALQPMIELSGALAADIPDTGKTRINLPRGGLIEPVTSRKESRLGQRITGSIQDQTESCTEANGGRGVVDVQRRNLAGMGGRFIESPNAWDPSEGSVAQETYEDDEPGVYFDYVEPGVDKLPKDEHELRAALKRVYGDSWWVDLERVIDEVRALEKRDPAQAARWFLNLNETGSGKQFDSELWKQRSSSSISVPEKELIVAGVDGARFDDALAIVAVGVEIPHLWPDLIIEAPEPTPYSYQHDEEAIDGAMIDLFERYEVWRVYIDPHKIFHLVERWQGRWGEKRIVEWRTNRPWPIGWAVRNFVEALGAGDFTHDGDPDLARHVKNAYRQPLKVKDDKGVRLNTLSKDRDDSPYKIDAVMAAVLAWEARGDAIAAGAKKTERSGVAHFL